MPCSGREVVDPEVIFQITLCSNVYYFVISGSTVTRTRIPRKSIILSESAVAGESKDLQLPLRVALHVFRFWLLKFAAPLSHGDQWISVGLRSFGVLIFYFSAK
jgi:hypothetical protein